MSSNQSLNLNSLLITICANIFTTGDVVLTLYRLFMIGTGCQGAEIVPVFIEEDQSLKYMKDGVILEDDDPALELHIQGSRGAARVEINYRMPEI